MQSNQVKSCEIMFGSRKTLNAACNGTSACTPLTPANAPKKKPSLAQIQLSQWACKQHNKLYGVAAKPSFILNHPAEIIKHGAAGAAPCCMYPSQHPKHTPRHFPRFLCSTSHAASHTHTAANTQHHYRPSTSCAQAAQYTPMMRSMGCLHMGHGLLGCISDAQSLHTHLCTEAPCRNPTSRASTKQITHRS